MRKAIQLPYRAHGLLEVYVQNQAVLDSVVKIFCDHSEPNYSLPWQRQRQTSSFCTGFLATGDKDERWILTNAHCVDYPSQVRLAQDLVKWEDAACLVLSSLG